MGDRFVHEWAGQIGRINSFIQSAPGPRRAELPPRDQEFTEFVSSLCHASQQTAKGQLRIGATPLPPLRHRIAPPLEGLRPITIAEAARHTNKICRGRVLFARTVAPASRLTAVHLLLCDGDGNVLRCGLYNGPLEGPDAFDSLPEGTPLALLEPYVKDTMSGRIALRCDHPQCVVVFRDLNVWARVMEDPPRFAALGIGSAAAAAVRDGLTSKALRQRGNELFKGGHVGCASDYYDAAAQAAGGDPPARALALSNRALCALHLRRWEEAERLAREALDADATHCKSRYRLAVALMWLRRWEDAEAVAVGLDGAVAANARILDALESARRERVGEFSPANLRKTNGAGVDSLPHASFVSGKVAEFHAAGRGTGMRATETIAEGELVLGDYALALARNVQDGTFTVTGSRSMDNTSQSALLPAVIREAAGSQRVIDLLHRLAAGKCTGDPLPDRAGFYDLVRIDSALRQNWFDAREISAEPTTGPSGLDAATQGATGLWLEASKINHSCAYNCEYLVFGAYLLVHAVRPIAAGEEVTVPYRVFAPEEDTQARRDAMLGFGGGFRCTCERCEAVDSSPRLRALEAKACSVAAAWQPAQDSRRPFQPSPPSEVAVRKLRAKLVAAIGDGSDRAAAVALGIPLAGIDFCLCGILVARGALGDALGPALSALSLLKRGGCSLRMRQVLSAITKVIDLAVATRHRDDAIKLIVDLLVTGRRFAWAPKVIGRFLRRNRKLCTEGQLQDAVKAAIKAVPRA